MSIKWTGSHSESGILRKSEFKEKKEELFVFGYSCKLFREDDRALHIDQGKHLIPWMGDETLKIDRYDARGTLHDLSSLEAPPGGYDWRVELTKAEQDVEQLCDEERYRALHTDEDEEEMYKEEELKRLHAAGYGQVGFNYDTPPDSEPMSQTSEIDEPFLPTPFFKALLPQDILLPETQKQNAIIEKTAKFIASQGAQMEILIKAKQGDNPQFCFLNRDSPLHGYYNTLIGLVKAGKWPEKKVEVVEEKQPENEEYLHPSLASTIIESAPSIPSIHYKPSADCDYTMLIYKMRGEPTPDEPYVPVLAPGEVPPPGTEPLPPHPQHPPHPPHPPHRNAAEIARAPVMYNRSGDDNHVEQNPQAAQAQTYQQQYAAYYHQYMACQAAAQPQAQPQIQTQPPRPLVVSPTKSTGLSLMKNYNTDSDSDASDYDDSSSTDSKDKIIIITPPEDIQVVIDKMAAYVARNGDEFAEIVRAKNDPRFTFLEPDNMYHAYYKRLMQQKRGIDVNGKDKDGKQKKNAAPVSFSIKKLKEPDPILPKPALPYESSSDEESENKQTDKQNEKPEEQKEVKEIPKTNISQINNYIPSNIPPVVVYKIEPTQTNDLPVVKTIEPIPKIVPKPIPPVINTIKTAPIIPEIVEMPKPEEKPVIIQPEKEKLAPPVIVKKIEPVEVKKEKSTTPEEKKEVEKSKHRNKESPVRRREKRKHRDKKKEYRSKSENRESRRSERKSAEREKKRDKESERDKEKSKRMKYNKEELENEIISLVDNSDDLIDLTGEQSDSKGDCEPEAERAKQQERRRRAAEFLKKVGVDPAAAALPTTSLASAMVDTLESLRKKKAEEEEKRRRRDKRRHRDRYEHEDESERSHRKSKRRKYRSSDDNEESDYDSSKRKKRKKEKKHNSKNKKKRKKETEVEEEDAPLALNIDLTNTLKELRTSSPTKELGLQDIEDNTQNSVTTRQESSSDEFDGEKEVKRDRKRRKKEEREYSEGEWSSDSEEDSGSSDSKKND